MLKDYLPIVAAIAACLLIIGALTRNTWLELFRARKLKRALALALQEEVRTLLDIFEKRGYIEGLRTAKAQTEATGKFQAYHFKAQQKYFTVFETNAEQIVMLRPPLSELVTRFYAQAKFILDDMERFEKLDPATVDPVQAIAAYDEVLGVFEGTISLGRRIVQEVSRRYPKVLP